MIVGAVPLGALMGGDAHKPAGLLGVGEMRIDFLRQR